MGILEDKVRSGQILTARDIHKAFRQLSKHLHLDVTGLHHGYFAAMLEDRNSALSLLNSQSSPPASLAFSEVKQGDPTRKTYEHSDFWELYAIIKARINSKVPGTSLPPGLCALFIDRAAEISRDMALGACEFLDRYSPSHYVDFYTVPTVQLIHMGMENFLTWKQSVHNRAPGHIQGRYQRISRGMLEDAGKRMLQPAGRDFLYMAPFIFHGINALEHNRPDISDSRPTGSLFHPIYQKARNIMNEWLPGLSQGKPGKAGDPPSGTSAREYGEWLRQAEAQLEFACDQLDYLSHVYSPELQKRIARMSSVPCQASAPAYYDDMERIRQTTSAAFQRIIKQRERINHQRF